MKTELGKFKELQAQLERQLNDASTSRHDGVGHCLL